MIIHKIRNALAMLIVAFLRPQLEAAINRARLYSPLVHGPRSRVTAHPTAVTQNALLNAASGRIVLEEHVFLGHNVSLLTGTHDPAAKGAARQTERPRSGRDIVVRKGAWIASNATVIGPCEIGEHAVVAAGSIVTRDVPPYHLVAGNPAKVVRILDRDPETPPSRGEAGDAP